VDRNHPDGDQALDTRDAVAGKGKRKRRKRTTQAATLRRINAKACDRQVAWAATGKPNETERLTRELDEDFDALRELRKGAKAGRHLHTSAASAAWASETTR
jgi:hypothetical protein